MTPRAPRRLARPVREPGQYAPIFVLSPPRSYSSVVATMLGQHPALAGLPELKLFAYRTVGELQASLPRYWIERGVAHRSPGLVRAVAQIAFGGQEVEQVQSALAWLDARAHWSGAAVLDVLLGRMAPRVAVEKSPENVASSTALRRLARAYPAARYLHLTRHPVTTQASMVEHRRRTVPTHPLSGQPMAGVAAWLAVHARIARFLDTLPPGRALRVRAEDVLNDPERQLATIARWLGLSADGDAIQAMLHPEASPFACFGPEASGIVGGLDPDFMRSPFPRGAPLPRSVVKPADWTGDARLWTRAAALACRLSYGSDGLRVELLRRRDRDHAARRSFAGVPEQKARIIALDDDNAGWLRTMIDDHGWPRRSQVGAEAASAAWLIAQHADRHPAFQRRCLALLEAMVGCGEASAADLARLADRVLLAGGEPQRYGTQIGADAGTYVAVRLGEPETVDARRMAVGLPPLAQQLATAADRFGPPHPAQVPCPGCGRTIAVWMPGPGGSTSTHCSCGVSGAMRTSLRTVDWFNDSDVAGLPVGGGHHRDKESASSLCDSVSGVSVEVATSRS